MPRRRDGGQVLVIFALALVALLTAAGLAFDIGRFYSEKRFLQNAADAAALAAANALIQGMTTAQARGQAEAILTRNFVGDPSGSTPSLPPEDPVYESGHAGDPAYLIDGILVSSGDVRVAVRTNVSYTFGRIAGLDTQQVGGRAHVTLSGDLLPIAVRHYLNAPGPTSGATYPCDGDVNAFQDLIATAETACLGTETNAAQRTAPSEGSAFSAADPNNDPAQHGPIITLVGQGAAPGNNASFRGFVVLDIRDFQSASSNVFYNGVTAGSNPNTLKSLEAGWIGTGYPGPAFPPATTPPDPNDQVGIMDGNSAGIVVSAIDARYSPGDEILAAVYSGTTMTIPDFTFTVPSAVSIATTQNRDNAVTMSVTKNSSFSGVVTTSSFTDWGDAQNPYGSTLTMGTFSPNPATPNTTITWTTLSTSGAPVGIYTVWVQGHSSSPYLTDHFYPVAVNVGSVARDFSSNGGGLVLSAATTGATATGTLTFSTPNNNSTYFGGTVNLSIEGSPGDAGALPGAIGSISVSPSSFTLNKGASQSVTVSVNGGSLGPGEYPLTIRATGTNSAGQKVTHLVPIALDIATAGTSTEYVDIMGFAVFRITAADANSIDGYAITPVIADMNDGRLKRGQVAKLRPW